MAEPQINEPANPEPNRPEVPPEVTPPEKQQTGNEGLEVNPGKLNDQNEVDYDSTEIKPEKPTKH